MDPIHGEAKVSSREIAGKRLEWFGKEPQWKIETEPAVAIRQFITSRHLEVVSDRGLQA